MSNSDGVTSVPAALITDAGPVAPSEPDILAGVLADITAALGGNVNQALTTPQGQLAISETAIIGDSNDQWLALFNGFDPRNASGRQQDAIGYIYFMDRLAGEGRAAFEQRRQNTVAANSTGANASLLGALLNLPGVTDAYVVDNPSDASNVVGGVNLPPRSLFICVAGGSPENIGNAILSRKNTCSPTVGSSAVTVQDKNPAYAGNGPSYTYNYTIPTQAPVYIAVTLANSPIVPSTALSLVQSAIASAFQGSDGGRAARIGAELFASRFYSPVASLGSWAEIVTIAVGLSANPTATTAALTIAQIPTISAENITLTLV